VPACVGEPPVPGVDVATSSPPHAARDPAAPTTPTAAIPRSTARRPGTPGRPTGRWRAGGRRGRRSSRRILPVASKQFGRAPASTFGRHEWFTRRRSLCTRMVWSRPGPCREPCRERCRRRTSAGQRALRRLAGATADVAADVGADPPLRAPPPAEPVAPAGPAEPAEPAEPATPARRAGARAALGARRCSPGPPASTFFRNAPV
jgi:hypothetical protein